MNSLFLDLEQWEIFREMLVIWRSGVPEMSANKNKARRKFCSMDLHSHNVRYLLKQVELF